MARPPPGSDPAGSGGGARAGLVGVRVWVLRRDSLVVMSVKPLALCAVDSALLPRNAAPDSDRCFLPAIQTGRIGGVTHGFARRVPAPTARLAWSTIGGVLSAIAIIPSAPVMVPELASGAAAELADLRRRSLHAAAEYYRPLVAVGDGPGRRRHRDRRTVGTFAGYGVDVRVALSPGAAAAPTEPLPLCALIAGWVRSRPHPAPAPRSGCTPPTTDVDAALARGRALRAEVDALSEPVGVLVVADGANTLTPPAPGGYDPDSIAVQAALDDALAAGDAAALTRLPDGIVGRVAYQVLAGWSGPRRDRPRELYRGAPYGVGYFVGVVEPLRWRRRPIAIIGPTGTGKSALALDVAERLGGEIVNADAMQLYRGMDIGTAKLPRRRAARRPAPSARRARGHRDRDGRPATRAAAGDDVEAIMARGAVPVIVGGSMLYVQSLLDEWAFPGHRSRRAGPLGGPARRGRRGGAARRARTRRRRRRGVDPAHRRPPHRAGPGGGGADRAARSPRRAPTIGTPRWDTVDHRIGLGHGSSRRPAATSGPTRCSPTASSTRCARCRPRACATASPRRARSVTPRC